MKKYRITVLPGDGIGPEVTYWAVRVLEETARKFGFTLELDYALMGGCAIDETGEPLPKETLSKCLDSDAVLLGAVGGYKWDNLPGDKRPEAGLLGIRAGLGLFANLRPAKVWDALKDASPLRADILANGLDVLVVRELTGGIYFGKRGRLVDDEGFRAAFDTEQYNEKEVKRIASVAFRAAAVRNKKVTSIDKANVLESSRFWREQVIEVSRQYPEIELNHMYVDNASMQLVRYPAQFDVIVTSNIFGDILSDEASMLTGSIGMLPSASLGDGKLGLYEPVHGSAPDIAGKGIANPLATILSCAMMLRYSLEQPEAADAIENAVEKALASGFRTADIAKQGEAYCTTSQMGQRVIDAL